MAFTREELAEYEKRPQVQVDDKINPFTGKTPPAATKQDPPADESVTVEDDADLGTPPSGDEVVTDPDEQGDGTSDENGANGDPSTPDPAAPSGETETTETTEDDGSTVTPPPKKGSAAERIQEVIDEREGYKAYGTYAQEVIAAKDAEIAELRKKVTTPTPAATATQAEPADPMPSMEDPGINYDPTAFNREVKAWTDRELARRSKAAATAASAPNTELQKVVETYNARAAKFAETHKDFVTAVSTLPTFGPLAARTMILSEDGPDLLYWLGRHKVDAVRIAKLPPEDQLLELGTIRATIKQGKPVIAPKNATPASDASKTPTVKTTKSTSNAPPPPTRVPAGNRSQARDIQDPGLSMEDFARRHYEGRQSQREASRKLRGLR
jgi:hypothetical protein